jgi:uncharacterized protein YecE (DUF72 family)
MMRDVTQDVRIGISGWRYPPWRGVFYPKQLPQRLELSYAAERLNSIEINGSFYALQRPTAYRSWREQTPEDFVFAVKGPRFITHMKKLRDVDQPLANFFASGLLALGPKLGPILWQLPPTLGFDPRRMADFLTSLPRSTGEAAYLARRHESRLNGRSWTGTQDDRPLRHAVEVRHSSFDTSAFLALAQQHAVAAVIADTAGKWPAFRQLTADFAYLRLHGAEELYTSGYDAPALATWSSLISSWSPRDAFVYFDNDVKVRAPFDAMALAQRLRDPVPLAGDG